MTSPGASAAADVAARGAAPVLCPFCGGDAAVLYSNPIDAEYFIVSQALPHRCTACTLVFLDPLPERDQLEALYPSNYQNFDPPTAGVTAFLFERYYQHQCRTCLRYTPPNGSLLEVGAGGGNLLERLRAHGIDRVKGVELSEEGCRYAAQKGLEVFHGSLEEYETSERFDMVFMSHVIEHVIDPRDTLRIVARLLKPGGVVYVETPNVGALDARLWGENWGLLHYPRHLYLFDRHTLATTLEGAGLEVEDPRWEINSCGWALSIQTALRRAGIDRSRAPRSFYYPLLLLGLLPMNLLDVLSGGGTAFMSMIGRKPGGGT